MKLLLIQNERIRRFLGILIPFVLAPVVVAVFAFGPGRKHYAMASLIITLMALVLFSCGFEKRKTGTRRMVLIAVMTALSVIGRFIFSVIPAFKPITAVVVITAMYIGGEAGFLTGAMSALISNFYFGQGPWTPFQMLSWGLIGLFAGLLSKPLRKNRILLSIYAICSGILFSVIMDIWTVVWYNGTFDISLYTAAMLAALPHAILYAVSNVVFLNLIARPFGEKLERIKIKYGC